MKIFMAIFVFLSLILLTQCKDEEIFKFRRTLHFQNDKFDVVCDIKKIKIIKDAFPNRQRSTLIFLYGDLKITNITHVPLTVNLDNVRLFINNENVGEINIASCIDYIIHDFVIEANKSDQQNIYWALEKIIKPEEIKSIEIKYIVGNEKFH